MDPTPSAARRTRALVVHDYNLRMGAVFGRILKWNETVVLKSSREALTLLMTGEHFDIILIELMMPEMNAVELHQQLAPHRPSLAERIVFFHIGGSIPSEVRALLGQIKNPCLEGPFDADEIRALLLPMLER